MLCEYGVCDYIGDVGAEKTSGSVKSSEGNVAFFGVHNLQNTHPPGAKYRSATCMDGEASNKGSRDEMTVEDDVPGHIQERRANLRQATLIGLLIDLLNISTV